MQQFITMFFLLSMAHAVNAQVLEPYLPESGVIHGDVMVPAAPREVEAIAQKMQAAVAANQDWFVNFLEQAGSDVLPYHENLGVSKEEYKMFLRAAEGGMSLQRVSTVEITVKNDESGAVTFLANPPDFPFHEVTVSADGENVSTRYGRLSKMEDVSQQDATSPTGRWSGPRWALETITDNSVRRVQFAIGKRDDFGDGIIYYDVTDQGGPAAESHSFSILYALK